MSAAPTLRAMCLADYDAVYALWQASDGVGLNESDERDAIAAYLDRNPGMSFVAERDGRIVGAVLCGHDGRRGLLHHLAVTADSRGHGLGRALVARGLAALAAAGISKCHLFVFRDNVSGNAFWRHLGWSERVELAVMTTARLT